METTEYHRVFPQKLSDQDHSTTVLRFKNGDSLTAAFPFEITVIKKGILNEIYEYDTCDMHRSF